MMRKLMIVGFVGLFISGSVFAQQHVPDYVRSKYPDLFRLDQKEYQEYLNFFKNFETKPSQEFTDSTCTVTAKKAQGERYYRYNLVFNNCVNIDEGEQISTYGWKKVDPALASLEEQEGYYTLAYESPLHFRATEDVGLYDQCEKTSIVRLFFHYDRLGNKVPQMVSGKVDVVERCGNYRDMGLYPERKDLVVQDVQEYTIDIL